MRPACLIFPLADGSGWATYDTEGGLLLRHPDRNAARRYTALVYDAGERIRDGWPEGDDAAELAAHAAACAAPIGTLPAASEAAMPAISAPAIAA